jgi:hypothetical protein
LTKRDLNPVAHSSGQLPLSENSKSSKLASNLLEEEFDDNFMVSTRDHKPIQPPSYESIYGNQTNSNLPQIMNVHPNTNMNLQSNMNVQANANSSFSSLVNPHKNTVSTMNAPNNKIVSGGALILFII